jgi:hypothetical protein
MDRVVEEFPIEKAQRFVYSLLRRGPLFYEDVRKALQQEFHVNKMRAGWFLHDMDRIRYFRKYPQKKIHGHTTLYNQPTHREKAITLYITWLRKNVPEDYLHSRSRKLHLIYLDKVLKMRRQGMNSIQIADILDIPPSQARNYIEELIAKGKL